MGEALSGPFLPLCLSLSGLGKLTFLAAIQSFYQLEMVYQVQLKKTMQTPQGKFSSRRGGIPDSPYHTLPGGSFASPGGGDRMRRDLEMGGPCVITSQIIQSHTGLRDDGKCDGIVCFFVLVPCSPQGL